MGPKLRLTACLGLVVLGLYCWLNAVMIGMVLISLVPASLNALAVLPVRALTMFFTYFISTCSWATIGWLLMLSVSYVRKQSTIPSKYIVITNVALVLLEICYLILDFFIAMIAL